MTNKEYIIKIYKRKLLNLISSMQYRMYTDEELIKKQYKKNFKKEIDLYNPKTFNEKIQWLKLNDRKDFYSKLVDKYEVRSYVKEKIGETYLNPLYGVFNSIDEIDIEALPKQFVLKTTHDSGGVIVCKDKKKINWKLALKELDVRLKQNYYYLSREYHYNAVKPRIICENLLVDSKYDTPLDYKIFCFNGDPRYIQVDVDRFGNHKRNFYDIEWNQVEFTTCYEKSSEEVPKPDNLEEMVSCAKRLSENLKFSRVDFYSVNNKIIFGEITFFPEGGASKFYPEKYDYELGKLLNLSE